MTTKSNAKEPGLPINVNTSHSRILIIDLLGDNDSNTAKRFSEFAADAGATEGSNQYSNYVKIHNLPMFVNLLSHLSSSASKINNPLIYLDGHGCPQKGLFISSANHYMPWSDLQEKLREINIKTNNTSGVVISTCHGMMASHGITFNSISPFQYCIAPLHEIPTYVVDEKMPKFLNTMLKSRSMSEALSQLSPHYSSYLSHEYFYRHFINHLRKYSSGLKLREMTEELTTALIKKQSTHNKDIKKARDEAKQLAKKQETHYYTIAKNFLSTNKVLPFKVISDYAKKWPNP